MTLYSVGHTVTIACCSMCIVLEGSQLPCTDLSTLGILHLHQLLELTCNTIPHIQSLHLCRPVYTLQVCDHTTHDVGLAVPIEAVQSFEHCTPVTTSTEPSA